MAMPTPESLAKAGSEHAEQTALFCWAALPEVRAEYPVLELMFAIPNGGERNKIVAGNLKAEGVKAGVLDIFLPVPSKGWHGLFIEMKVAGIKLEDAGRKPNKPTGVIETKSESPKVEYPTIRCDSNTGGWNLPIDLSGYKAGDKLTLVALVNVKEIVKRDSESENDKESGVTGELNVPIVSKSQ